MAADRPSPGRAGSVSAYAIDLAEGASPAGGEKRLRDEQPFPVARRRLPWPALGGLSLRAWQTPSATRGSSSRQDWRTTAERGNRLPEPNPLDRPVLGPPHRCPSRGPVRSPIRRFSGCRGDRGEKAPLGALLGRAGIAVNRRRERFQSPARFTGWASLLQPAAHTPLVPGMRATTFSRNPTLTGTSQDAASEAGGGDGAPPSVASFSSSCPGSGRCWTSWCDPGRRTPGSRDRRKRRPPSLTQPRPGRRR